jgi:outer membrane murein-binding lipoprotein Lpp
MIDDETKHAISLAACYLAGGDSPPIRAETTPTLARAVLALHAEVERMRPVVDALDKHEQMYQTAGGLKNAIANYRKLSRRSE